MIDEGARTCLELAGAVCMSITGWLVKGHSDRLRQIEADTQSTKTELSDHKIDDERYKLEAEQRFAKDIAVQATLSRLHERIDEISADTKAILRNLAHG